jgi:glucosamine-6-phosphate deaminase
MKQLKSQSYMHDCWLFYRGAWYEWELHEIDMAVQTKSYEKKRYFLPSVSKDRVMYQGNDSREFWVRAEDRNKHRLYDELGTWYEAIEAFAI